MYLTLSLNMAKKTAPHIVNTSANLLGFCLFVITSLRMNGSIIGSKIDEFTSVIAVFLVLSCLFSFFSIRSKFTPRKVKLEKIADLFFIVALIGILIIILLITLNFIQ
ncbi:MULTISPECIES: hypothetical protein [Flavobacterium]|nr:MULTISPECIES: hypothetical protein [Flavobacterium]